MAHGRRRRAVPSAMDEARRRATILRRYAAIEKPSLADDERHARELGLGTDSLYRLARSWRRHKDETLLTGARTRSTPDDRRLALAAAESPDLSEVNPTRRPLIRSRIAALRSFLEIDEPTNDDERRAAASLDMTVDAFRRLLRSWLLARDPAALPGGSTPARTPKRRTPALSREVEAAIADTIADLGAEANSSQVHREAAKRCRDRGIHPPNPTTVYHRFVEARAAMLPDDSPPTLAVDHTALTLPVTTPDGVQLPVLSAVVVRPSGRILAHALSLEPPTAHRTAALLALATRPTGAGEAPAVLYVGAPKGEDWDALLEKLTDAGVAVEHGPTRSLRPGHVLTRIFGGNLGRIRLRPRIATRPRDVPIQRMGRGSQPLTLAEAREVVDGVVEALNAERQAAAPGWVAPRQAESLLASLKPLSP